MIRYDPWLDISNYTLPLTPAQLAYIKQYNVGVTIGLQDAAKAAAFQMQLDALQDYAPAGQGYHPKIDYYVDKPGRDLSICPPGALIWLDVEKDCLDTPDALIAASNQVLLANLRRGFYGNEESVAPVIGASMAYAALPLWYPDYRFPDWTTFKPFNGFTRPKRWQYSDAGLPGDSFGPGEASLNCDLSLQEEEFEVFTRLNRDSAWFANAANQLIDGSRGVNARLDFADLPPTATEIEVELTVSSGREITVCDGDEGDDSRIAFHIAAGLREHGRVKLDADGWFHFLPSALPAQSYITGVSLLGYYL